jgi:hypothetical protein
MAMDENLVGYLLKALDPETHRAVEDHLRNDPEAPGRLALLERALAPLAADAEIPGPPPGLALATLARIAEHECRPLPPAPPAPRREVGGSTFRWARRADVLAAAALLFVVAGLALTALTRSWSAQDRSVCMNNLRTIWGALERYGEVRGDGAFPQVVDDRGPRGVAAAYVPLLQESGVLEGPMPACPCQTGQAPVESLEAAFARGPEVFSEAARTLSGGYAYSLGYREGGVLFGLRQDSGDRLPILADAPPVDGSGNSPNHGGAGQLVLRIGGHAGWCTVRTAGEAGDDIFVNQLNELSAGVRRTDTVLGPGDASPIARFGR